MAHQRHRCSGDAFDAGQCGPHWFDAAFSSHACDEEGDLRQRWPSAGGLGPNTPVMGTSWDRADREEQHSAPGRHAWTTLPWLQSNPHLSQRRLNAAAGVGVEVIQDTAHFGP